jgi:DNA-binding Lrp family transcriptional regulator
MIGRGGAIRTPDPLRPRQVRYQAALRPDMDSFYTASSTEHVGAKSGLWDSGAHSQFAIRECRMEIVVLKPQDVYVALKIVASQGNRAPYSQLAAELVMSPSEVHASVRRAEASHLLHGSQRNNRPNFSALEEFLLHGLKYVFPPERGELIRGVPTSYGAEPLHSMITRGNEPSPVWPYVRGTQRGIAFEPLYKTAPIAALRDSCFYEYLALADALRDGRARERKTAEAELCRRFREANARLQS